MKRLLALACLLPLAASASAGEPAWSERIIQKHASFEAIAAEGGAGIDRLIALGDRLFSAKFTRLDGAGRPRSTQAIIPTARKRGENAQFQRTGGPDAGACASCHNEPVPGGAGDFVANVFVSEGFESADFDSVDPQFSNERNSNALMGSGLIEMLAREMTSELHTLRRDAVRQARQRQQPVSVKLLTKGVDYGEITAHADGLVDLSSIQGIDGDLTVRPFSQKGVFASLRQFTVNAMNVHHGMLASERFGARWTGTPDFDGDAVMDELSPGDISAVVAFQATLPMPTRRRDLASDWQAAAKAGEASFAALGCARCHRPSLPLKSLVFTDPGPSDTAGTLRASETRAPITIDFRRFAWARTLERNDEGEWLVPLFGDLKRHVVVDAQVAALGNEIMGQRFVERDVFITAELWGIASTPGYGHRGDLTTLEEAIRAHGGEARRARDAYVKADDETRSNLIAFLKTLIIEKH